jgi:hypothetical protein
MTLRVIRIQFKRSLIAALSIINPAQGYADSGPVIPKIAGLVFRQCFMQALRRFLDLAFCHQFIRALLFGSLGHIFPFVTPFAATRRQTLPAPAQSAAKTSCIEEGH